MSSKPTLRRAFQGFVVPSWPSLVVAAPRSRYPWQPYRPAHLESMGPDQPARVILTDEAQRRIQLHTTLVSHGADISVDHVALVYDKKGKPWVFTVMGLLPTCVRPWGSKGERGQPADSELWPAAGTEVVTVGAIELWGTELEIAGSH